jgi:hypothetical protein
MNDANDIREATHMNKRVESMEDGRYIIYFTFPNIEKDVKTLTAKTLTTKKPEEKNS